MMSPKVLINSLPKSGTHLLAKAVELFGYQEHFSMQNPATGRPETPKFLNYRGVRAAMARQSAARQQNAVIAVGTLTPTYADPESLGSWLADMPAMSYLLGHVSYHEQLPDLLLNHQVKHVFIIRDPRAVLVSLLSFIPDTRGMPDPHFLEADFKRLQPAQQLELLLSGGYAPEAGVVVKPFAAIFRGMLNWRDKPGCLLIRFEDLVGEQGGGTLAQQQKIVRDIAEHLGQPSGAVVSADDSQIYRTDTRTFRKGSIDSWQQSLDPERLARIQDYCRPLCLEAGYPL